MQLLCSLVEQKLQLKVQSILIIEQQSKVS